MRVDSTLHTPTMDTPLPVDMSTNKVIDVLESASHVRLIWSKNNRITGADV